MHRISLSIINLENCVFGTFYDKKQFGTGMGAGIEEELELDA